MNVTKDTVYQTLQEYTRKPISDENKLVRDLSIYGDDFEELIEDLSRKLQFDMNTFFELFDKQSFYNPPEFYLKLPKIFYLDIRELIKGKIVYQNIDKKGKDISVRELIDLIEEVAK